MLVFLLPKSAKTHFKISSVYVALLYLPLTFGILEGFCIPSYSTKLLCSSRLLVIDPVGPLARRAST